MIVAITNPASAPAIMTGTKMNRAFTTHTKGVQNSNNGKAFI
jgi:hypothetical protein